MLDVVSKEIKELLRAAGVEGEIELAVPPRPEMGDVAFPCFGLAKERKISPVAVAQDLAQELRATGYKLLAIERVEALGPYVNFYLSTPQIARMVIEKISRMKDKYGRSETGKGKKIMVEYAQPNTHKAFHIGHLRNIVTGESLCRIFENAGYKVARVNYQGDVGLHIAKCLYEIIKNQKIKKSKNQKLTVGEKIKFLSEAYAAGHKAYEESEEAKKEIAEINEKIYSKDKEIYKIYKETRKWSLEYFNKIYKRVGVKFDRLYFESETFERGRELVKEYLGKGVFKASEGAVIFEGEKFGLHNRVFLNSQGLPTYEAKDTALAELQFKEYNPNFIYHVVGKEQTEYFKVLFKALEQIFPESIGKEKHLVYGWVNLKEGKMSSRAGNVALGEWLIDETKKKLAETAAEHNLSEAAREKIALAAVKYAFLRTGAGNDIAFDFKESVSLSGDSGPYLLYIVARIKSIFRKGGKKIDRAALPAGFAPPEKKLLLRLAEFPEVTTAAAVAADPAKISHYLLDLAQDFNIFYNECPVLKAEGDILNFRLQLIKAVEIVVGRGLNLLGIEIVNAM